MAELPALIAASPCEAFDVAQLVYNVTAWDVAPEKLVVARRPVRLRGYRGPDTSTICLADTSGRRSIVLAVIPPHTERTVAEFALELAGLDGARRRANEILECAASDASPPMIPLTPADRLPVARWETDGGRVFASRGSGFAQRGGHRPSIEQVAGPQHSADPALAGEGAADDVRVVAAQPVL